jgi:hypothetical protein
MACTSLLLASTHDRGDTPEFAFDMSLKPGLLVAGGCCCRSSLTAAAATGSSWLNSTVHCELMGTSFHLGRSAGGTGGGGGCRGGGGACAACAWPPPRSCPGRMGRTDCARLDCMISHCCRSGTNSWYCSPAFTAASGRAGAELWWSSMEMQRRRKRMRGPKWHS